MAVGSTPTGLTNFFARWRAIARVIMDYRGAHKRLPNLAAPRRFTEKIQWRKLFDHNPYFTVLCDKLAVRDFIAGRAGPEFLIPLLWSGQPEAIPFDALEPPYVLKSTHASGQIIMVLGGEPIDREQIRAKAAAWLKSCYGTSHNEPGYINVPRRLMIERTLTTATGATPEEIRVFVFDGKAAILNTVLVEAGKIRNGAFHTPDWRRLDWHITRWLDRPFPPPERLHDILRTAEKLGAGFDHIRVDFYNCGTKIHIGEITLYAWSGLARFTPDEADFLLGNHWKIPNPLRRATKALFHG